MSSKDTASAPVDAFIGKLEPPIQGVAMTLRQLIRETAPEVQETIKWGMPCYEYNGLLCSINPAKAYVNLQIFRSAELTDPDGLLEGTGKAMRHVKVRSTDSMPSQGIRALLKEAIRLRTVG